MSARFEILDWQTTPMGQLSLRRRHEPVLDVEIYEVQLNDEHLMSSLFTHSESELARLGVACHDADGLDVLVGGLGLGYTALAALAEPRVGSVTVIEALEPVIDWQRRQLLPDSVGLAGNHRCRLVCDDFFALVAEERSATRYDAVLLDIDHTPEHVLHTRHSEFYSPSGLRRLSSLLRDDGVFALWSDDPPEPGFLGRLGEVFAMTTSHVVTFPNPHTRGVSSCTVYVARHFRPVR